VLGAEPDRVWAVVAEMDGTGDQGHVLVGPRDRLVRGGRDLVSYGGEPTLTRAADQRQEKNEGKQASHSEEGTPSSARQVVRSSRRNRIGSGCAPGRPGRWLMPVRLLRHQGSCVWMRQRRPSCSWPRCMATAGGISTHAIGMHFGARRMVRDGTWIPARCERVGPPPNSDVGRHGEPVAGDERGMCPWYQSLGRKGQAVRPSLQPSGGGVRGAGLAQLPSSTSRASLALHNSTNLEVPVLELLIIGLVLGVPASMATFLVVWLVTRDTVKAKAQASKVFGFVSDPRLSFVFIFSLVGLILSSALAYVVCLTLAEITLTALDAPTAWARPVGVMGSLGANALALYLILTGQTDRWAPYLPGAWGALCVLTILGGGLVGRFELTRGEWVFVVLFAVAIAGLWMFNLNSNAEDNHGRQRPSASAGGRMQQGHGASGDDAHDVHDLD